MLKYSCIALPALNIWNGLRIHFMHFSVVLQGQVDFAETTETENGNGKRTGLEWTGVTKNSVNAFFSVGEKLAYLFIH